MTTPWERNEADLEFEQGWVNVGAAGVDSTYDYGWWLNQTHQLSGDVDRTSHIRAYRIHVLANLIRGCESASQGSHDLYTSDDVAPLIRQVNREVLGDEGPPPPELVENRVVVRVPPNGEGRRPLLRALWHHPWLSRLPVLHRVDLVDEGTGEDFLWPSSVPLLWKDPMVPSDHELYMDLMALAMDTDGYVVWSRGRPNDPDHYPARMAAWYEKETNALHLYMPETDSVTSRCLIVLADELVSKYTRPWLRVPDNGEPLQLVVEVPQRQRQPGRQ
jgi:hypothetical protein